MKIKEKKKEVFFKMKGKRKYAGIKAKKERRKERKTQTRQKNVIKKKEKEIK